MKLHRTPQPTLPPHVDSIEEIIEEIFSETLGELAFHPENLQYFEETLSQRIRDSDIPASIFIAALKGTLTYINDTHGFMSGYSKALRPVIERLEKEFDEKNFLANEVVELQDMLRHLKRQISETERNIQTKQQKLLEIANEQHRPH